MALVGEWEQLQDELPSGWTEARVRLTLETPGELDRVIALLSPLQPLRGAEGAVTIRIVRRGDGPGPASLRRGLARLDSERLHALLAVSAADEAADAPAAAMAQPTLAESWDAALTTVPADWSDLLGEIELDSSDYLEPGAVLLAPINPRRVGNELRLQFRSASRFGYGASAGMVRRCLERCDNAGIRGRVEVVRALSDTYPVATQGPVWQIDGRTV